MIKTLLSVLIILACSPAAFGQHEYASIEKKEIEYRDWTYRNVGDGETNLREFVKNKKLVLIFYFAPWCHSSRYQAPVNQQLYERYSDKGLGIIGISMYDTVEALKYELKTRNLTFPVVIESTGLSARKTSQHYKYRWSTGDHRKWGTPWNIFLVPSELADDGEVLTKSAFVANGELREEEAEAFIRKGLGLPPLEKGGQTAARKDELVFKECRPAAVSLQ